MDKAGYRKKFQEECYVPIVQRFLNQTLDDITQNADKIHKEVKGQLDSFLRSLCVLQERKELGTIGTVCISFPYTSLSSKTPYLLFQAYSGIPFVEDSLTEQEFQTSWLFSDWERLAPELLEHAQKLGMSLGIHSPYVKSRTWGAARVLLRLAACVVKYHLYNLNELHSLQILEKDENFTLTFGEYMDWQRPIFALRSTVDIFQCDEKTDLQFRNFKDAWYEDKSFSGLNLKDCVFESCTFRFCKWEETDLKDARFLGCTFQDCYFEGTELNGARFDGCKLERISMSGIKTTGFANGDPYENIMYGMAEFIGCRIKNINLTACDLSAACFSGCRIEDTEASECTLPEEFEDCIS